MDNLLALLAKLEKDEFVIKFELSKKLFIDKFTQEYSPKNFMDWLYDLRIRYPSTDWTYFQSTDPDVIYTKLIKYLKENRYDIPEHE